MFNINKRLKTIAFLLFLAAFCLFSSKAEAYYVSGAVEFTYSSYQTRVGDKRTTSQSWTENYSASIGSFVYDPRFMRFSASVGYSINHTFDSPDSDTLTYSLKTSFFPGRMVSWDLYASNSVVNIPGTGLIGKYNVESTGYGGAASLRLSGLGRNGRRNNNNNNYNNNYNNYNNYNNSGRGFFIPLPDIMITVDRQEATSKNSAFPLHETRDRNALSVLYRPVPMLNMVVDSAVEDYDNLEDGTGYHYKSMNLNASVDAFKDGDLKITGHTTDRESWMIVGANPTHDRTWRYDANLELRASQRLWHRYSALFERLQYTGYDYTRQGGSAQVQYYYLPELSFSGSLNYAQAEQVSSGTISSQQGGLTAGVNYNKTHSPTFLDPFNLITAYSLSGGFATVKDEAAGTESRGMYYENYVNLGLRSIGWKFETVALDYSYRSKRDDSPVNADNSSTVVNLSVNTTRVPRTGISASGNYSVTRNQSGSVPAYLTNMAPDNKQLTRSLTYSLNANHAATPNLSLDAGVSQGNVSSNSSYTLATLTTQVEKVERRIYYGARYNYYFTRFLFFQASAREEQQDAIKGNGSDSTTRTVGSTVRYQLRRIFLSLEYTWRQDMPEFSPRSSQQLIFAKLSRPF